MTNIDSFAPRPTLSPRAPSTTIYRDTPLPLPQYPAARPVRSSVRALASLDNRVSDALLLGLGALTAPAIVYSLVQALDLVPSGSLEHAIRAFLP